MNAFGPKDLLLERRGLLGLLAHGVQGTLCVGALASLLTSGSSERARGLR